MEDQTTTPLKEGKKRVTTSASVAADSSGAVDKTTTYSAQVAELVHPAVFEKASNLPAKQLSLVLCDASVIALCVLFGSVASAQILELLNYPPLISSAWTTTSSVVYLLPTVMVVILSSLRGHYTKYLPFWTELYEVIKTLLIMGGGVFFALFLLNEHLSRLWLMISWASMFVFVPVGRSLIKRMLVRLDIWYRPLVVVEADKKSYSIAKTLTQNMHMGYKIVATISLHEVPIVEGSENTHTDKKPSVLSAINGTVKKYRKSHLLLVLDKSEDFIRHRKLIDKLSLATPNIIVVPPLSDLPLMGTKIIGVPKKNDFYLHIRLGLNRTELRLLKRVFDIVFSAFSLLLLSPVFLFLGLYIFFKGGAPFYAHKRIGRNGKSFDCWKFRTMKRNSNHLLEELLQTDVKASREWKETYKLKNDPRITSIGKILRETSLDELPQLWNVLKGDMSIVGPRPIVTDEIKRYGEKFDYYKAILPGLTGLWQVSGRNDIEYSERVDLDVWYVRNWSLWTDIVIILSTFPVLLGKKGAY